eukprot:scaffold89188_cov20-Prasinocladus_malaysianus.AAC.1
MLATFLLDLLGLAPQAGKDSIADIAANARLCSFPENAVIARQGAPGLTYYVILQGRVAVFVQGANNNQQRSLGRLGSLGLEGKAGQRELLGVLEYGACLGDVAFTGAPFSASFKCLEATRVLEIDARMVVSAAPHRHLATDPSALASFPVLAGRDVSLLALLAASLKSIRFRPGETIVFQGPLKCVCQLPPWSTALSMDHHGHECGALEYKYV